jgi:hypothetical protein
MIQALITPALNFFYTQDANKMVRVMTKKDQAVAVSVKPRDKFISFDTILQAMEAHIGTKHIIGYHNPMIDWQAIRFAVVQDTSFEVIRKDLLNIGIRITHSIAEIVSTSIQVYVYRQWCSNGATTQDTIGTFTRSQGFGDFDKWVGSAISEANKTVEEEKKRLQRLTEITVTNKTSTVVEHILSNVPRRIGNVVRDRLLDVKPKNLYDVYNAITEISTHYDELFEKNPDSRFLLESAASSLTTHENLCPVCKHHM